MSHCSPRCFSFPFRSSGSTWFDWHFVSSLVSGSHADHYSSVTYVTARQSANCAIMRSYDEGEIHPVALGSPLRRVGRLLRPTDDGTLDELLCIDALQSRQPIAGVLRSRALRRRKPFATGSKSHGPGRHLRRVGHAASLERSNRHNHCIASGNRASLLLTAW